MYCFSIIQLIITLLVTIVCRGHSFISLNETLLDEYAECETAAEVIDVQNRFLQAYVNPPMTADDGADGSSEGDEGGYLRACDLPPADSDEYEEYENDDQSASSLQNGKTNSLEQGQQQEKQVTALTDLLQDSDIKDQ